MANEGTKRDLYYGGRKTDKLVRCYSKKELGVFRVELELHSGLLRDISTLDDFVYLPDIVYPKHLQFVGLDWGPLLGHATTQILPTNVRPLDENTRALIEAMDVARKNQRVASGSIN